MYMTMARVAPENMRFSFPTTMNSDVRELSDFEMDAVSGGISFRGTLNYFRATFDAAPVEAQFLFFVGTGAAIGAIGGPGGAFLGGIGGAIAFIAS